MTNELLATRIAKAQAQGLRRTAVRRRLARSAAQAVNATREHTGSARRMRAIDRALSWARRPGAAWRASTEEA